MGALELFVIAVGVAMDAFAVAVCKGLSVSRVRPKHIALTGLWFGGFQALMPLLGFFLGTAFADFVSDIDHWMAFILLAFIGLNMIRESFIKEEDDSSPDFSVRTMFVMAVATSIDALAVGVSFAFFDVDIWTAVLLIGLITAILSSAGVVIGNLFGSRFKSKAEFAGGLILVVMGLKILFEHLFFL
ncbi:MAG: manganese efflux pump [Bacteroidales bacterium]|nr:manganese efflux pump [Bacteroidales bacterium]